MKSVFPYEGSWGTAGGLSEFVNKNIKGLKQMRLWDKIFTFLFNVGAILG